MSENKKAASGAGNTTDSMTKSSIDSVAQSDGKGKTLIHVIDIGDRCEVNVCGNMGKVLPAFCALTDALSETVPHQIMCAMIMAVLDHTKINPMELAAMKIKSQERERHVE